MIFLTTAEKIKAIRKATKLTQKELGKRMNISEASVAQYESGKRNPKFETLQKIANALGVGVLELYPGDFSLELQVPREYTFYKGEKVALYDLEAIKRVFDSETPVDPSDSDNMIPEQQVVTPREVVQRVYDHALNDLKNTLGEKIDELSPDSLKTALEFIKYLGHKENTAATTDNDISEFEINSPESSDTDSGEDS